MLSTLKPRCAGICYPKTEKEALSFFRNWFDQPSSPSWKPQIGSEKNVLGLLVPHIDYRVTQTAYAWAYEKLLTAPVADTYLILGVGHQSQQEWSLDARNFLTPFGEIPADFDLIQTIAHSLPFPTLNQPKAHEGEHSIEFPVVALTALRKLMGIEQPFRYIPLLCGGLHEHLFMGMVPEKDHHLFILAETLRKLHDEMKGKLQIIISIDGCHLGPRFKHPYLVTEDRLVSAQRWEESLWKKVESHQFNAFFQHLFEDANYRYFDGVGALALWMQMFPQSYNLHRTHYEQWFDPGDASAVTFSSGYLKAK